jgi:putative hydrolase of the HAD superfamily
MVENLDLSAIQEENARTLIKILLNQIEQLSTGLRELREENQKLRDEINRVKGEHGKPDIKGDLLDQETKMERSGLAGCFESIEVVSHKTPQSYKRILERHSIRPERFLMVGNSLKSDILPALELGAWAVHIPYEVTWLHEAADAPVDQPRFYALEHIGQLPGLLEQLA